MENGNKESNTIHRSTTWKLLKYKKCLSPTIPQRLKKTTTKTYLRWYHIIFGGHPFLTGMLTSQIISIKSENN